MANLIEEVQSRLAEAQKKLAEATQNLQIAQQTHAQAAHQNGVWQAALQMLQREEQVRQAAATKNQLPLPTNVSAPDVNNGATAQTSATEEGIGKTDTVRDILRRHPTGMTAREIWQAVSSQFKHRPYLYSVLKRLRDRDEVLMRRNKYYLKLATRIEEIVKEQQPFVH